MIVYSILCVFVWLVLGTDPPSDESYSATLLKNQRRPILQHSLPGCKVNFQLGVFSSPFVCLASFPVRFEMDSDHSNQSKASYTVKFISHIEHLFSHYRQVSNLIDLSA